MALYLSVFARMHTNDIQIDKKRHKTYIKDNTSRYESSKAIKSIPGPKTTKLSTRMWIRKTLNEMFLEKNLEKKPALLERA